MTSVRELSLDDATELTSLYEDNEWWEDREVPDIRAAPDEIEVAIGVEEEAGDGWELVAAARVLTDYVYYGMVFDVARNRDFWLANQNAWRSGDVIVASDRRDEGYGEMLLQAVVDHPDLQDLSGLSLLCREGLVPFYESIGFELYDPEMEIPEGGREELVRMTYQDVSDAE